MQDIEFREWPKTPRLFRDMTITEKLDGGNGAIGIVELTAEEWADPTPALFHVVRVFFPSDHSQDRHFGLYAQSRNRLISPGKSTDLYGFAQWVAEHAATLVLDLGVGLHFGEVWGGGIQRGYGLAKDDKRFSLFNTKRYADRELSTPGLGVVPVLYRGPFDTAAVGLTLASLEVRGSRAVPGYRFPEGVVVYHSALNRTFKVTVEGDDEPKSQGKVR